MSAVEQKARELTRPALETVCRRLARWNVSPDWVTYTGMFLTLGVAALAALGEQRWAGVALIFASACDSLDGTLARVSGKGSRFGAFLDSTIDRLEESAVFLGLSIYYARAGGELVVPLILVATIGSLMVSYTRARAESVGVACSVGLSTRPARVLIMIVGLILEQVPVALIVLAVTSAFTVVQRMLHVWHMTGGEPAGWGAVKTPYQPPVMPPPAPPPQAPAVGGGPGDEEPRPRPGA